VKEFFGLDIAYKCLIIIGILAIIILLVSLCVTLLKPVIKRESMVYIYAFGTGFLIVLAILGLLSGALEKLHQHYNESPNAIQYVYIIIILVSGALTGFIVSFYLKHIILSRGGEIHANHENHQEHNHDEHIANLNSIDNSKNK
jgi:uncharacterized membrane protein